MSRPGACLVVILVLCLITASAWSAAPRDCEGSIAAVVARVQPTVVRIVAMRPPQTQTPEAAAAEDPLFAIGSGFIIDPSGYIATNKHVVAGAMAISVTTMDGVRHATSIVGGPAEADMALLKINVDKPLPAAKFGDSDKMHVGDTVIAIGSPFGFEGTVTAGIVSAVNRDIMESPFDDYIQTDAPINHGNSGGPLFNLAGEVVGMNSVLIAPANSGSAGLGFAIPSSSLSFVFDRLMASGKVGAGMLPIRTQQITWMLAQAIDAPSLAGALVDSMEAGSAALGGQIQPGDIILSFNGEAVEDPRDLARKAARAVVGSEAVMQINRGGQHLRVHVPIQLWPEARLALPDVSPVQPLGLQLAASGSPEAPQVVVAAVDPNGTAARSGLQKGDVILQVQQIPISAPDQALRVLHVQAFRQHPYTAVLIDRDGNRNWIAVKVAD
jgi:serine protease Do